MRLGPFKLLHKFVITDGTGSPYLIRWSLFECPWFSIKLHHILRSDHDRHLHDHPWSFVSIILWGGYYECRPCRMPPQFHCQGDTKTHSQWFGPLSVICHRATDAHRLEILTGKTAWTLVFCGPKQREWGFWTPQGWQQWERYLGL